MKSRIFSHHASRTGYSFHQEKRNIFYHQHFDILVDELLGIEQELQIEWFCLCLKGLLSRESHGVKANPPARMLPSKPAFLNCFGKL